MSGLGPGSFVNYASNLVMREYDGIAAAVGTRLASWRRRRGLTRVELAARVRLTPDGLADLESGRDWMDRRGRLALLAAALRLEPAELTGQPYPPSGEAHAAVRAVAFHLRRQMSQVSTTTVPGVSLDELAALTAAAKSAEMAGDEHTLALALPELIHQAGRIVTTVTHGGHQWAENLRVDAHVVATGLLRRTGYKDLAWTLLHRARPGASEPIAVLVEEVKLLLALGLPEYALARAARAARAERAGENPELPALCALAQAMAGRRQQTEQLLAQAGERVADEPSQARVAAARAAVAVEFGEMQEAVELARSVDRAALSPAGAARLLITAAIADARLGETGRAVAALAEVEEASPLRLRLDPFARELLAVLPARTTDTAHTDSLNGLAERAGLR